MMQSSANETELGASGAGRATRRQLLSWSFHGLGATALTTLLLRDRLLGLEPDAVAGGHPASHSQSAAAGARAELHHKPRVRRVVHVCLIGGLSHVDSFDYKPLLDERHGKPLGSSETPDIFFGQVGLLRKSDWTFRQHGDSGLWISDMFPEIAELADELTVIRSMTADSANHTPALYVENSGFQLSGFPSLGSWMSYGLGSETDELPTFVVLPDARGLPNGGASMWSSGFLPAEHQGVVLRGGENPVRHLFPTRTIPADAERASREFLQQINDWHGERSGGDPMLDARARSYELAARMQRSIPRVHDLSSETEATCRMYGLERPECADFGHSCLLARRLLEEGVRFVQLFSGGPIGGSPRVSWDAHENVLENHSAEAVRIDQPVAALIRDLRQRGLLEETLLLFTTEFGRTPFAQSAADQVGPGRDHNRYGFSVFLAGAGVRGGMAHGATDDVGWKSVEDPVSWHDFHATVLHLLGIDHRRLTFYHNGIHRRLTNVHGEVVEKVLS
jgi:hypothetical protein